MSVPHTDSPRAEDRREDSSSEQLHTDPGPHRENVQVRTVPHTSYVLTLDHLAFIFLFYV